jgi:hypothetical protein
MTDDDLARRTAIERYFDRERDPASSHDMYHDDVVLEFPQSSERFEGVSNLRPWRDHYPQEVEFRVRRITGSGDVWVVEVSASYDGGPWKLGVGILEFDGPKVRRERIYTMEPWEPPDWRAPWRAARPADP